MTMAIKVASNGNVEYITIEGHGAPANRKQKAGSGSRKRKSSKTENRKQ